MKLLHLPCRIDTKGFTIIEVLVVIIIIGIMAALVKVKYRPLAESLQLKTAANIVKGTIVSARARAMANPSVQCGVYFKTSNPQQMLVFYDNNSNYFYDGSDTIYITSQPLPGRITMENPSDSFPANLGTGGAGYIVVFRGDGSSKWPGSIIVKNSYGKKDTIDVLASTGRVKVKVK
jgi:prepilin-type N-terminal cleavage/methylation domain-containing protein